MNGKGNDQSINGRKGNRITCGICQDTRELILFATKICKDLEERERERSETRERKGKT